ncbi:MAG TPA: BTAD domain-containing putative transcriptional regulator, partial [Longimicrobiales bacterium]|nr:BTAD domain-containing putative transcriptional regulator [Longimicrobiales bacterium]
MPVRLTLLGGFGAILDEVEQDWIPAKKLRAALLTYIAMERRASRETLTAFFWPESDEDRSRHALRQTLYTLREGLGDDWVKSGPLEIRATAKLETDAADFDAALGRGDPAGAASLYRGPFLAGVHLLSNHAWEEWVDARRAHYEGAFRKACRDWVDQRVAAGDPAGALTAARRWAAPDPLDDEAQHTLIELLAATGERAEAVRQYERYQRLLEAEELEPLDETRALVDKLRHARSLPAPSRRSAMEAEEAPPAPTHLHTQVPATDTGPVASPPNVELAHEPHHHRGPRRWAAAVLVLAALTILALLWPRAGTLPLSRASSAPPDTATYAVLPVTGEGLFASRWNPTQLIHDAVAGWSGITVVDHFRVREAVEQEPSAVLSLTDARRMAAGLGAGRFLFGDVHPQGDSAALSVALYESDSGRLVREAMVVVAASGAGAAEGVERLTEALLLGDPLRIHAAAHRGTRSVPAAAAMARGMDAVWDWELGNAAEAFRMAVDHDPVYAQGWLWLGLVESWTQPRAPARWVGNAQRALAAGEALSAHDQDIAAALAAQGRGEFPGACARWRSLAARDSLDFVPWYGLGTCLRSDDV